MGGYGMPLVWLAALVGFAVLEGITPSALVSIWFSAGALAALITSAVTDRLWIQIAVFLAVSCICFALLRPLVRRFITPRTERTNSDRLLGQEAVVMQEIDDVAGTGQVNVQGRIWTARSAKGEPILKNMRVKVLRIEGVKLIVEPLTAANAEKGDENGETNS